MAKASRAVVVVLAVIVAILPAAGCSRSNNKDDVQGGGRPIVAADIPTSVGSYKAFFSNDPQVNQYVPVDFAFEGPWDFREGPVDSLVESKVIGLRAGFASREFPRATEAVSNAIKGRESLGTVAYFAKTNTAYLGFGQAGKKLGVNVFSVPETILRFPANVGNRWSDHIVLTSKPPTDLDVERKVVGQGVVKVPAGTFKDAIMLQIKKRLTESDGTTAASVAYQWYAPRVGIVAWIAGRNNEPGPLFKEAALFQRLKTYK